MPVEPMLPTANDALRIARVHRHTVYGDVRGALARLDNPSSDVVIRSHAADELLKWTRWFVHTADRQRRAVDPLGAALWWKADVARAELALPEAPLTPSAHGPAPGLFGLDAAGHAFEVAGARLRSSAPRRSTVETTLATIRRETDRTTTARAADALAAIALEHGHLSIARDYLTAGEAMRDFARFTRDGIHHNRLQARVLVAEALATTTTEERRALGERATWYALRAERFAALRPETRGDPASAELVAVAAATWNDERRQRRWTHHANDRVNYVLATESARTDPELHNRSVAELVAIAHAATVAGVPDRALPVFAFAYERLLTDPAQVSPDVTVEFQLGFIRALRAQGLNAAATTVALLDDRSRAADPRLRGEVAVETARAHVALGRPASATHWIKTAHEYFKAADHQLGLLHTESLTRSIAQTRHALQVGL